MSAPSEGTKGLSTTVIVLMGAGFVLLGIVGLVVAFAWPAYVKRKGRVLQSECKTWLKAAYTAEKAYFAERDVYSENTAVIGLTDEGTKRSVLLFAATAAPFGNGPDAATLSAAAITHSRGRLGVEGHCPVCNITIACAANIDADAEIDVWTISTDKRLSARGEPIPAGVPYNDFNDVTNKPGDN